MILQLVKIPHSNLSKVTRMVLVQICSMMMLTTSHTTATGMLSVLPYTTMTGRNVSATTNGLTRVSDVAQLKVELLKENYSNEKGNELLAGFSESGRHCWR